MSPTADRVFRLCCTFIRSVNLVSPRRIQCILRICYCIFPALFIVSCQQEVNVEMPPFQETLVIEGYVAQGAHRIFVRVDKTQNPTQERTMYVPYADVSTARVTLTVKGISYRMKFLTPDDRMAEFAALYRMPSGLFVHDLPDGRLDSVHIAVDLDGLHAESDCIVPPPLQITRAALKGTSVRNGRYTGYHLTVDANFPSGTSYYLVFLRMPPSGDTVWYDIGKNHLFLPPTESDDIVRGFFRIDTGGSTADFILDNPMGSVGAGSRTYRVYFSRIEQKYYDIALKAKTQFEELASIIPTETTDIPSLVKGGYGIFTGLTSDTLEVISQ